MHLIRYIVLYFSISIVFMIGYYNDHIPKAIKTLTNFEIEYQYFKGNKSALQKINLEIEKVRFFRNSIIFKFYKNGTLYYESHLYEGDIFDKCGCKREDKFAFILHGWKQNCKATWIDKLIDRLSFYRGGCIICVDYEKISDKSYIWLYRNFEGISKILLEKLQNLIKQGFDPSSGYIFGFSFGAQLASSVGRSLHPMYAFQNMDLCDIAGPIFDFLKINHTLSAKHVQCLHSSHDKGTSSYTCHQNVRLGFCGYTQTAVVTQDHYTSHGLCVQIYINAFDYPFYPVPLSENVCFSKKLANRITKGFRIGYNEMPDKNITGDIFVPTSPNFPYNLSEKELVLSKYEYN